MPLDWIGLMGICHVHSSLSEDLCLVYLLYVCSHAMMFVQLK